MLVFLKKLNLFKKYSSLNSFKNSNVKPNIAAKKTSQFKNKLKCRSENIFFTIRNASLTLLALKNIQANALNKKVVIILMKFNK
jgi:hypothetical protein